MCPCGWWGEGGGPDTVKEQAAWSCLHCMFPGDGTQPGCKPLPALLVGSVQGSSLRGREDRGRQRGVGMLEL